jgi:hypothetical protein
MNNLLKIDPSPKTGDLTDLNSMRVDGEPVEEGVIIGRGQKIVKNWQ